MTIINDKQYTGKEIIKRLLREHIAPYKRRLFLAIFCMVIVASCIALNAWMIQPALDQIFIEKNRDMLMVIPLAVFFISFIGAVANYGNTLSMRYIGQRIIADMQTRLFEHLMKSDIGLFHQQSSGRLISRFTNDINLLRNAFSNVLTAIAKESLSMLFLLGVMLYQNATLAFLALIAFPIAIYPIIRLGKRMRRLSDKTQNELGDFTTTLDEIFGGVRTVKSYNREAFEVNRASGIIESLFRLYYKSSRVQAAATPMIEVLSGLSIALVIWYGGSQVLDGTISTGAFFSFITAFLMAYKPVRAMSGLNGVLQEGIAAANRLFNIIDTLPKIIDVPDAKPLIVNQGNIRFENVLFNYTPEIIGINGVTLDVPAGKTAALVGLSGGGKSTLMNLLLRFYDVQAGSISIDGQDIKEITLHSLREAMSFVPQESMLFDDSIKANIAYGRHDASDEEIIEAAKNASADGFINALPEGYDTMIGAHGVRLSGGQRQRIAIARAMLKNAPILLLDEATSSLDNESESNIQQALQKIMKGRTTLVIAHRLSTIVSADIIYVVEGGQVIESGSHENLLEHRGKYYQLYANNFGNSGN
ncbi:MAG: ABC transporter ATP-binding protein [Rickettsiales bacterium]